MTDAMDQPDGRPSITVTITFTEGTSVEDMTLGIGQEVMIVGSDVSNGVVVSALLRAAESLIGNQVRAELEERESPLRVPPDGDAAEALVSLNARLGTISVLTDMPMMSPIISGLTVD